MESGSTPKSEGSQLALVKSYILKEASGCVNNKALQGFYHWQAEALTEVPVSNAVPQSCAIVGVLSAFEKTYGEAIPKECFENSLRLSECGFNNQQEIAYVEGYILDVHQKGHRVLYSHAWKSIDGQHFDVTSLALQKVHDRQGEFQRFYFKVLELGFMESSTLALHSEDEIQIPYYCNLKSLPVNSLERGWKIIENMEFI